MNDKSLVRVHWSFWAISAVALLWNVMGIINFFAQMNTDLVTTMPESYRAIIESRPAWSTAAFAVAVFGGALGSLLLLLKKSAAYYFLIASLLGAIVQMPPYLGEARSAIGVGVFVIFAAFLTWYSKQAERKAWIS